MKINADKLEKLFFFLMLILFLFVAATIIIIRDGINITQDYLIEEDYVEVFVIIVLFIFSYLLFYLYKWEIKKRDSKIGRIEKTSRNYQEQLDEAFKYIGQTNVELQTIKEAFAERGMPHEKSELKRILNFLTEKAMAILASEWAVLRLLEIDGGRIIRESMAARDPGSFSKPEISSRGLLAGRQNKEQLFITTDSNDLTIKAFFVFPERHLNRDQKMLVKAIAGEVEMIYVIYSSNLLKQRSGPFPSPASAQER